MLSPKHRRADIRKCALVAAAISAVCVVALEVAGSSLQQSYAGLNGKPDIRSAGATAQPASTAWSQR